MISHVHEESNVRFFHNGDFSGDVIIKHGETEVFVPYAALLSLVAEQIRQERISEIEQADTETLVFGRKS